MTSLRSIPVALVKTLIGAVLILALSEIRNAGKIIVQPFKTQTVSEQSAASINVGEAVATRLVNTLGMLKQELQQDVIRLLPSEARDRTFFALPTVSGSAGHVDAALGKTPPWEFGNIKIPLSQLVEPILCPIRALLGVRVIEGSVQVHQDRYVALAISTTGEVWKTEWEPNASRNISPEPDYWCGRPTGL